MLSHDELTRLIEAQGESPNLDGKAPMLWDGGVNSASLAKDIVAFANSRDGGAIVIGKSEPVAGRRCRLSVAAPARLLFPAAAGCAGVGRLGARRLVRSAVPPGRAGAAGPFPDNGTSRAGSAELMRC